MTIIKGHKEIFESIKKIQANELRDRFLVAVPIIYILGYVVWSVNAYINNLGMLPAFEFQYLLAGSIFIIVVGIVYSIILGIYNFILEPFANRISEGGLKGFQRLAAKVFWARLPSAILGAYLSYADWFELRFEQFAGVLSIISVGFLILSAFIGLLAFPGDSDLRKYFPYCVLVVCTFLAVSFYLFLLYPIIPQELGGLCPRCAYLDLRKKQVSDETIRAILPKDSICSASEVIRSRKVDVMFSCKEFVLVKPYKEKRQVSIPIIKTLLEGRWPIKGKPTIFEIRKEVIRAVIWCGDVEK